MPTDRFAHKADTYDQSRQRVDNVDNIAQAMLAASGSALLLLDAQGQVLETRELRTSGYSTSLELQDIDGDGHQDVLVLNSAGKRADVIYGPLWDSAQVKP